MAKRNLSHDCVLLVLEENTPSFFQSHKSFAWFVIATHIHLLCTYYAFSGKDRSLIKTEGESHFWFHPHDLSVSSNCQLWEQGIQFQTRKIHRSSQDGCALSLIVVTAPSHFVEPCGCSLSVLPERWGSHFWWYAGQFCDKKWINLVIFPSLQVRSLLFFFLWKPVSHPEKSEEREWVNRHREA